METHLVDFYSDDYSCQQLCEARNNVDAIHKAWGIVSEYVPEGFEPKIITVYTRDEWMDVGSTLNTVRRTTIATLGYYHESKQNKP